MRLRNGKAAARLDTKSVTVDLIGGGTDYCKEKFDYLESDGGIKSAPTLKPVDVYLGRNICTGMYISGTRYSAVMDHGGSIYLYDHEDPELVKLCDSIGYFGGKALAEVDGAPAYLFYGRNKKMCMVRTNTSYQLFDVPFKPLVGVYHYGRMFMTDYDNRTTVRWTGKSPLDWNESIDGAGRLELEPEGGKIVAFGEMGDDIVIFRETAIQVMHAMRDARNFRVEAPKITNFGAGIHGNTVGYCRGKLYFATARGLYSFDGNKAEHIDGHFKYSYGLSYDVVTMNDRYVYSEITDEDDYFIAEYDVSTGKSRLFACYTEGAWVAQNNLFCAYDGTVGMLSDEDYYVRHWDSLPIDFGSDKQKILKYVYLDCDKTIKVEINSNGLKTTIEGPGRHFIKRNGTSFTFTVRGVGQVRKMSTEWEVRE